MRRAKILLVFTAFFSFFFPVAGADSVVSLAEIRANLTHGSEYRDDIERKKNFLFIHIDLLETILSQGLLESDPDAQGNALEYMKGFCWAGDYSIHRYYHFAYSHLLTMNEPHERFSESIVYRTQAQICGIGYIPPMKMGPFSLSENLRAFIAFIDVVAETKKFSMKDLLAFLNAQASQGVSILERMPGGSYYNAKPMITAMITGIQKIKRKDLNRVDSITLETMERFVEGIQSQMNNGKPPQPSRKGEKALQYE